ncbi:hypothetical protein AURDEDRAFT_172257 [Auricularia subglabra TFB-10046 SS5]|nr:hypothetical protein AURDEDRAFT_172257 [Auricularia subglabra TFB-10046 SS5]
MPSRRWDTAACTRQLLDFSSSPAAVQAYYPFSRLKVESRDPHASAVSSYHPALAVYHELAQVLKTSNFESGR